MLLVLLVGCIPPPPPSPPPSPAPSPAPKEKLVSEQEVGLQNAIVLEKERKYPDAIAAYQKIIIDFPQSPVAADALFAIAYIRAYYDNPQKDFAQALADFSEFEKLYPNHEKAREAQNWQAILKSIIDLKKENNRLRKSIEELENVDIRHEEKRRR
jgi:outer membrane protein assembly factor BamD (BamD/ComL family)